MPIVVLYGPQGAGKTDHARNLMEYWDCGRVIDPWNGRSRLPPNVVAVTNVPPPYPPEVADAGLILVPHGDAALRK